LVKDGCTSISAKCEKIKNHPALDRVSGHYEGSIATYTCPKGKGMFRRCLGTGKWSGKDDIKCGKNSFIL